MKKFIYQYILLLTVLCGSFSLHAAQSLSNISPQQLEQFKKLSPAQQKSLAQSMGVDISTIQKQMSSAKKSSSEDTQPKNQQYFPRGTKFDEFGNPTFDDEFAETNEEEEEDDGTPKPFGYDVFANAPTTFAPTMDIAVPAHYIIGAGDVLNVQVFGKENLDLELEISREGKVIIPELGPFSVAGLTFSELKKYLANEIKNKILGVDVVVTLADMRSLRVFVLGDAFKPGSYVLNSLSSITHALFAAGGINEIGSLRNIQLKRAGKLVATLDLYDLLIAGDSSDDLLLKSGDVVFVAPLGQQVTVSGEVRRPAIYELQGSENFGDVIEMSGGLLPSAFPSSTVVERFNKNNLRSIVNVDLSNKEALSSPVKAGDFINVMETTELFQESVTVIGAVTRPGNYQWIAGQKITDLLPNIHSYMLDDADLTYSLVIREKNIGRNIEVLQFSLFDAISNPLSADNIALNPRDKLLIFSNVEVPSVDIKALNAFASTKQELLDKEKEEAEKRHEEKMFWQYYGENADTTSIYADIEVNKAEETLKQTLASIDELTGVGSEVEPEVRELNFFSRKRLLAPVIEQLKRQAAAGQPLQLVEVDGAVKTPGMYPLVINNKVSDLIKAAGGLKESAYLSNAELTRNEVVSNHARKLAMKIDLGSALQGDLDKNLVLKSKDRLNVHHIPAWQENHIVELRGEFMFPGKYTIQRGETLRKLIERAGGFTDFAYLNASLFTREKLKKLELENLVKVSENLRMEIASKSLSQTEGVAPLDYEQTSQLLADLTNVEPVGRLVLDIPLIMSDEKFDVILENGDVLYMPVKLNSVNVVGQVQLATSHIHKNGFSAFDYIQLSGGSKKQADEDRVYVIKANGAVEIPSNENWFSSAGQGLKPGDTVVVPLDTYFMEDLTLWASVTQIIYQSAVAVKAISGL
jgi:polysaccharide export outer membrane protein